MKVPTAITYSEEQIVEVQDGLISIDLGWQTTPMLSIGQWVDVAAGIHEWMAERQAEINAIEAVIVPLMDGMLIETNYSVAAPQWRSQTNHEAAAREANVAIGLVEKHTTTKTTVAWAQVTKTINPGILSKHTTTKLTGYKFTMKEDNEGDE